MMVDAEPSPSEPADRKALKARIRALDGTVDRLREQLQSSFRRMEVLERKLEDRTDAARAPVHFIDDPIERRPAELCGGAFGAAGEELDEATPSWGDLLARPSRREDAPEGSWWPLPPDVRPPLRPQIGWANLSIQRAARKVIGVVLLGLERSHVLEIEGMIARKQAQNGDFAVLYIYDGRDFDVFRQRGLPFEWIPPTEGLEPAASERVIEDRIAFLERKWGLARLIWFGGPGEDVPPDEQSVVSLDDIEALALELGGEPARP